MASRDERLNRVFQGLGDVPPEQVDRYQNRYLSRDGQAGEMEPSSSLPPEPLPRKEEENTILRVEILVKHLIRQGIFTRKMNFLDPPLASTAVEIYTDPWVNIPGATAGETILRLRCPDGGVTVVNRFGNQIETPTSLPFTNWYLRTKGDRVKVDQLWETGGAETRTYDGFHRSLGVPDCPCPLQRPIILIDGQYLDVVVDNNDQAPHLFEARLQGWTYVPDFFAAKTDVSAEYML